MTNISCKPISLASYLVVLREREYKVEKVYCADMFSNTIHVECVVLMTRL